MPRATEKLFGALSARIGGVDRTRRRVDQLVQLGHLSRRAGEQVYESLFLNCFTAFEVFIEEVFLTLLVSPASAATRGTGAVPRVAVRSLSIARELVVGPGRKYVDWFPYDRTVERAKLFFRGGRPFTDVSPPQQELLNKAQLIRNLIAHRSRHSEERFQRQVIAGTALAPREHRPAAYLRGAVAAAPPVTRYEVYATALLAVAKQLT